MTVAYVVRCNFARADLESAWNDWYSGPKLKQMLAKPMFRTGQRFYREAGPGRNYLAFWVLESPAAFETHEYKSDWGFFEWKPHITDWSRDLFEPLAHGFTPPRVGDGERLHIVAYDGAADDDAVAADRAAVSEARPKLVWMRIVGLDRHSPYMGVEVVPAGSLPALAAGHTARVQTLYRPISIFGEREKAASR